MSVLKTFDIALDKKKALYGDRIVLVEGDTGNRFVITLTDDGTAVNLTDCRVDVVFSGAMGTAMQNSYVENGKVSIGGILNNEITIDVKSGSYSTGLNTCEIRVLSGEEYATLVTSASFTFNGKKPIIDEATIVSSSENPILVSLIAQVNGLTVREQSDWTQTDDTQGNFIQHKPVVGTDMQDATQNLTAETTLSDADTVPFYDASATAHRKSTWANIVAKIRTALFGSITGVVKADGAGNISVAVANTDYAAAAHASRHAAGAADPTVARYSIAVTATWTGASAPFTQEVSVTGVTAGMIGKVDIVFDDADDLVDQIAQRDAFALVDEIETGAGIVTLTCFEEAPEVAFDLQMEVIL